MKKIIFLVLLFILLAALALAVTKPGENQGIVRSGDLATLKTVQ